VFFASCLTECCVKSSTILRRVADGDAAALDECLDKYGGLVWSLARRLCQRHEDAEDSVQQIFVDVWRSAVKFDPERASEATYITMIARRRLIDSCRRRRRDLDAACLAEEPPAGDANHERRIDITDEAEHVHKYIEQLRPAERRVLELSINDGMSQSQVARALNLPLGTVKTHARRGLIRLRKLLEVDAADCILGVGA